MLNYQVSGRGQDAVVLLHSLGSNLSMWAPQLPSLEARYSVIAIDHLGHGKSPAPEGPYGMSLLAREVIAVMDHLGVEQAHVVGISMGGHLALWLGLHYPQRVRSIVALCTAPTFGDPSSWAQRVELVLADGTASIASSVADRWLTAEFAQANPAMRQWIIDMVSNTSDIGYAGCCAALGSSNITKDLGGISAPVLAIAAAKDPGNPVSNLEFIARHVANGRLHVVENAAHLCNVEQPEEVTRLILEHLAAH